MHPLIEQNRERIATLCRQYGVARLEVFGSILRGDFDSERSDVDVLVEFEESAKTKSFQHYFGFKQALENLFGRPVDVVELKALRNRRLRYYIEHSKMPVYAAA
jgi:hypothetical protein